MADVSSALDDVADSMEAALGGMARIRRHHTSINVRNHFVAELDWLCNAIRKCQDALSGGRAAPGTEMLRQQTVKESTDGANESTTDAPTSLKPVHLAHTPPIEEPRYTLTVWDGPPGGRAIPGLTLVEARGYVKAWRKADGGALFRYQLKDSANRPMADGWEG